MVDILLLKMAFPVDVHPLFMREAAWPAAPTESFPDIIHNSAKLQNFLTELFGIRSNPKT